MDRAKLTFSQAEGLEPIPGPLALGELPQELRASIWAAIYRSMQECRAMTSGIYHQEYLRDPWASILRRKHLYADHRPIDEFQVSYEHDEREVKDLILALPYNKVFDFLQHVLRDKGCPPGLAQLLQSEFTRSQAAYDVIEKTIVSRALKEEGDTLRAAFAALGTGQFAGAPHLRRGEFDQIQFRGQRPGKHPCRRVNRESHFGRSRCQSAKCARFNSEEGSYSRRTQGRVCEFVRLHK
ncbi:MAG: hypothetical protein HYY66_09550 [Candidatus Tectomicrobia bacterium]|nr:hypothetical protein [Candidatus Tectomicrobia bacterium]